MRNEVGTMVVFIAAFAIAGGSRFYTRRHAIVFIPKEDLHYVEAVVSAS